MFRMCPESARQREHSDRGVDCAHPFSDAALCPRPHNRSLPSQSWLEIHIGADEVLAVQLIQLCKNVRVEDVGLSDSLKVLLVVEEHVQGNLERT